MEKRTKTRIIIGSVALFAVMAIGLQVLIYTQRQKDIERLNIEYNAAIQGTGQENAGLVPSATPPTTQPTTEPTPQPTATPEVEPTPQASPQVTPQATAKPTPQATPKPQAPTEPEYGTVKTNPDGTQECYMPGYGWVEYAGSGGEQTHWDVELSGNQVGQ